MLNILFKIPVTAKAREGRGRRETQESCKGW